MEHGVALPSCNTNTASYPRALDLASAPEERWQERNMLPTVLRNVNVSGKHWGQRKGFGPGMVGSPLAAEVAAHMILWYVQKMSVVGDGDFSNKEVMASRGSIHQR